MMDWVKLDPIQLGQWLAPLATSKERGEFVTGLQAGALGALPRIGSTKAEIAGHTAGATLLAAKHEDMEAIRAKKSQAGKAGNAKRWGDRKHVADPSHCDKSAKVGANRKSIARGEERREEQQHPKGDVVVLRSEEGQKNPADHPITAILESLAAQRREESPGWIDALDRDKRLRLGNLRLDLSQAREAHRLAEDDPDADAGGSLRRVNEIRAEIMAMGANPDV